MPLAGVPVLEFVCRAWVRTVKPPAGERAFRTTAPDRRHGRIMYDSCSLARSFFKVRLAEHLREAVE